MNNNTGRGPIIDHPIRSWSIAKDPFGDEHPGYAVSCYDPLTDEHEIVGDLYPTAEEATAFLDILLDT